MSIGGVNGFVNEYRGGIWILPPTNEAVSASGEALPCEDWAPYRVANPSEIVVHFARKGLDLSFNQRYFVP